MARFAAFCLFAVILFERSMTSALIEHEELRKEQIAARRQIEAALLVNKELKAQIAGSEDVEWVEMAMMRVLGVVPEGYQKILFKEPL